MAKSVRQQLDALKRKHAYRQRRTLQSPQDVTIDVEGRSLISFCSNDYLGLANHPRVRASAVKAIRDFGIGSGASQLVSGYSSLHAQLEEQLAEFFGYPRCVLFSSGYMANLGVISSLAERHDVMIGDRLNHASLIDAARYAGIKLKRYHHCDHRHTQHLLAASLARQHLLVSDGVFSMEGSIAPLIELSRLKGHNDLLIVDDAHGIGVLGADGKGTLQHLSLAPTSVDILIGTFGKSFGSSGAFVLGDNDLIDYIIQKARTLIYTTAPPAACAAAALQSLHIIKHEPQRRTRLHDNIHYFRQGMQSSQLNLLDSSTAIQSILIGDNQRALQFSHELEQRGCLLIAIRPPTVPEGTARLRITLSSEHSHAQIDFLLEAIMSLESSLC